MSRTIDEKVVSMQFDNKNFEKNAATSLNTLDKLTKAASFNPVKAGFKELENAVSSIDFSSLVKSIYDISQRFSLWGIVGDQVIRRLTDGFLMLTQQAIGFVKSVSIDQMAFGWQKYADKTAAVQTIMAATAKDFTDTGEQMEYVTAQLDKLNWFTDETSYSFLDMVSNIGKFTSNNIKLDDAVTSMEGISTWAAISGANVQDAARAMYNLAQAISVGAVKRQDWMSIETANMATAEFKQMAIDAAVAEGTLTDLGNGLYETLAGNEVSVVNFNENLKDEWFTSKALIATLNKYGGFTDELYKANEALSDQYDTVNELLDALDEYKEGQLDVQRVSSVTGKTVEEVNAIFDKLASSEFNLGLKSFKAAQEAKTFQEAIDSVKEAVSTGWMNSFELIFGNYQEAKRLWTDVANGLWDIFAEGGEARNELLKEWHEAESTEGTYYNTFAKAITNLLDALYEAKSLVSEIFGDILPSFDVEVLKNITDGFYSFSSRFKSFITGEESEVIVDEISALEKLNKKFKAGSFDAISEIFAPKEGLGSSRLKTKFKADDFSSIAEIIPEAEYTALDRFKDIVSGLGHALNILRKYLLSTYDTYSPLLSVVNAFANGLLNTFAAIGRLLGRVDKVYSSGTKLKGILSTIAKFVIPYINLGFEKLISFLDSIDEKFINFKEHIKTSEKFGSTWEKLYGIFTDTKDVFIDVFNRIKSLIENVDISSYLNNIKNTFKGFGSILNIARKALLSIVLGIPNAIQALSDLTGGFFGLTGKVGEFVTEIDKATDKVNIFQKIGDALSKFFKGAYKFLSPLIDDLKNLGVTMWDQLVGNGWQGLFDVFNELLYAFTSFQGVKLAYYFTDILDSLADVPWELASTFESSALLKLAACILAMAVSLRMLSKIDPDGLTNGILGMSTIFGLLTGFTAAMKALTAKNTTLGLVAIAGSLVKFAEVAVILAVALKMLSSIPKENIYTALIALGGVLAEIVLFIGAFKALKVTSVMDGAFDPVINLIKSIGPAMILLALAIKLLAGIDSGSMLNAISGIGFVLLELVGFLGLVSKYGGAQGANGMFLTMAATSILTLTGALLVLSFIKPEKLLPAIAGLGLVMAELGSFYAVADKYKKGVVVGSLALLAAVPALLAFSATLLIISNTPKAGESLGLLGAGLAILAVSLLAMNKSIVGAAALLIAVAALNALMVPITLLAALPVKAVVIALGEMALGLVGIALAIGIFAGIAQSLSPTLGAVLGFSAALALAGVGLVLIGTGLQSVGLGIIAIAGSAAALVAALSDIIVEVIEMVLKTIYGIAQTIVHFGPAIIGAVLEIISAVLYKIAEYIYPITEAIALILVGILEVLTDYAPKLVNKLMLFLIAVIDGLANAIRNNHQKLFAALRNLISSLLELAISAIEDVLFLCFPQLRGVLGGFFDNVRGDIREAIAPESLGKEVATSIADSTKIGFDKSLPGVREAISEIPSMTSETLLGTTENGTGVSGGGRMFDIGEEATGGASGLFGGMESGKAHAILSAEGLSDDILNQLDMSGELYTMGGTDATSYGKGFADKSPEATTFVSTGANSMLDTLRKKTPEYGNEGYRAGDYYTSGLEKGLYNKLSRVSDASRVVANTIAETANRTLQIASPSKVAMRTAMFYDQGLAQGLIKHIPEVDRSTTEVGNSLIMRLKEAVKKAVNYSGIEEGLNPVIRPVLDLTDIQASAHKIDELIGIGGRTRDIISPIVPRVSTMGVGNQNEPSRSVSIGAITINTKEGQDPRAIAKAVMFEIQAEVERKGHALA